MAQPKNAAGGNVAGFVATTALCLLAAATGLVSAARAAEPIKIGMVAPLTGPAAESGGFQTAGAKLAVEEINKAGGVLGRPLELTIEDDQTTNPGIVLAFSKLASNSEFVAFLGSIRSTQVHAMAPDVLKLGKPVMIGGTDPQLTHMGNPWLFRFRPNDVYSARVIADYGAKVLGKKRWAIVHSTDAFGTNGMKNLSEALKGMGIEPVLTQGYANGSQDFTPVALAVKQSGADVMGTYMTFEPDQGIFAKQLRQLGVHLTWVGSPTTATTTALKLAGAALYGSYAVVDFNRNSSEAAKAFAAKYEAAYKSAPDIFASWTYDAVTVLAGAIGKAKSTEPDKIREALLATRGFEGAEGTYTFDANGDGLHGYNIVRNDRGTIVFDKHIDFND
ncbi:MAG: ABC transporter substrate-binding protein [Bradyrhizobiaceae bacterium]|nr:ABC transporter substrate-binding protein [Bradyrhizobiaceae bacterium]